MALNLKPLFQEADVRAERTVSIIRILIAGGLLAVLVSTVIGGGPGRPAQGAGSPLPGDGPPPPLLSLQGAIIDQAVVAVGTIVVYLCLGLLSLYVIQTRRYRGWMVWPFATADVVFALVAVWLSLLNSELVGAYAPLLPACWLLVIVLAFGALRYNPLLQAYLTLITAGGLAFVIWLTGGFLPMGWMRTATDPASPLLVRPPTIMRLVMLGTAGAVLTLAVHRARQMLRRATADAARRDNLVRYLPRAVSDLLAEGAIDELRQGRRDPMAVLFVDVRGFTGLAEDMDTAALSAFMTEFRRRISRAAEAEGGVVDKFVGDGAMIVFGLDAPHGDDAARAVACTRRILAEMEDWNRMRTAAGAAPVRLAIGAHWGEAFCGAVGDETRLEFTVLGDVVNVASRLEARAKSEDVAAVASGAILERAGDGTAGWESLGVSSLRGRDAAMDLFALR